jgi:hypothetical protein
MDRPLACISINCIGGAAWRLLIQTWALSPYGVLAGMLMFSNKQGWRWAMLFINDLLAVDV